MLILFSTILIFIVVVIIYYGTLDIYMLPLLIILIIINLFFIVAVSVFLIYFLPDEFEHVVIDEFELQKVNDYYLVLERENGVNYFYFYPLTENSFKLKNVRADSAEIKYVECRGKLIKYKLKFKKNSRIKNIFYLHAKHKYKFEIENNSIYNNKIKIYETKKLERN